MQIDLPNYKILSFFFEHSIAVWDTIIAKQNCNAGICRYLQNYLQVFGKKVSNLSFITENNLSYLLNNYEFAY